MTALWFVAGLFLGGAVVWRCMEKNWDRGYEQVRIVGVNAFKVSRGNGATETMPRKAWSLTRINGGAA